MRLSEIKGEQALDVIANIIEPAADMMADEELVEMFQGSETRAKLVAYAIRNHKREVIEIMAAIEMQDVETYTETLNLISLPKKIIEIFDDDDLMELFTSQGQTSVTSGSVLENITASTN